MKKYKKFEIRLTGQTTLFRRDFQTLSARAARATLSLNAHQVCTPKSNNFLRETAVKRISFFLEILMLYEVYICLKSKNFRKKVLSPLVTIVQCRFDVLTFAFKHHDDRRALKRFKDQLIFIDHGLLELQEMKGKGIHKWAKMSLFTRNKQDLVIIDVTNSINSKYLFITSSSKV